MLEIILDRFGDGAILAMAGPAVDLIFGATAQYSRFVYAPHRSRWRMACSGRASISG